MSDIDPSKVDIKTMESDSPHSVPKETVSPNKDVSIPVESTVTNSSNVVTNQPEEEKPLGKYLLVNRTRQVISVSVYNNNKLEQVNIPPKGLYYTNVITNSIRNLSSRERSILQVVKKK